MPIVEYKPIEVTKKSNELLHLIKLETKKQMEKKGNSDVSEFVVNFFGAVLITTAAIQTGAVECIMDAYNKAEERDKMLQKKGKKNG